jgi:hypothetical protein
MGTGLLWTAVVPTANSPVLLFPHAKAVWVSDALDPAAASTDRETTEAIANSLRSAVTSPPKAHQERQLAAACPRRPYGRRALDN